MMEMSFPGGAAVDAHYRGFTIRSDQPAGAGGGGAHPAPFDLFLASIGTCAGFYAVAFCRQRELPVDGLGVRLETVRDPERKRLSAIRIEIDLPAGFPEKYRTALLRAVDQCAVKRHIVEPPEMTVEIAG
jgi:ribosomal protein S12 methylthiotransferase accessory factor